MPPAASWPLAAHFSTMLQKPEIAFKDPELQQVSIQKDAHNQPLPRSGSFANVYKGTYAGNKGSVAIRVFTSGNPERRERYQAVSEYLTQRPALKSLVRFNYTNDGIRSTDGKRYPLVTMEWVTGETLLKWLRTKCLNNDRQSLDKVSNLWIDLVGELTTAGIAHGDLQHANVMITEQGQLKLVDYDCMCVPKLIGLKNLEIGVDPYQHPARNENTLLNENLDNFSALFIFVALKALAATPGLWNDFVEQTQYDKLLFRREDLDNPNVSELIQTLRKSPDSQVAKLCNRLVDLAHSPIESVPRLNDVLFDFKNVEVFLSKKDFDGALELLDSGKKKVTDAPALMQPKIRDAQERVQARQKLDQAFAAGDEPAMQRLYVPKLLDDYPRAQPLVAAAKTAPQVIPLLSRMQAAVQAAQWRDLVAIWDANIPLLENRKSAESYAPLARTWRGRNRACDDVLRLLQAPSCDAEALAEAWRQLDRLGGHPEAVNRRSDVERLLQRGQAWSAFQKVPHGLSEAVDAELVRLWNEPLFAGWNTAESERPRVAQANQRLLQIQQLNQCNALPLSVVSERQLVDLAAMFPAGYDFPLQRRVRQAAERLESLKVLHQALQQTSGGDLAVVEAWKKLDQLGGGPIVDPQHAPRIAEAGRRSGSLTALKAIPSNYTIGQAPQFDAALLAAWNEELLNDCGDARPWQAAYLAAVERRATLDRLKSALAADVKEQIVDAAESSCLQGYPLPADWARKVKDALAHLAAIRGNLAALQNGDRSQFLNALDVRIIIHNPKSFEPERDRLRALLQDPIVKAEEVGLSLPTGRSKAIEAETATGLKIRAYWKWPDPRFGDQCVLAVCRNRPAAKDDPRTFKCLFTDPVRRKSFEEARGCRIVHLNPEWLGSYVVVWALIDLGFQTFWCEHLVLGRLEKPAAKTRK